MIAWRKVSGFLPVLVLVVDALPVGLAGDARGPVVRIRADLWARGDEGLVQHELEHVRQFYRLWALGAIINAPLAAWLALHAGSPLSPLQAGISAGLASIGMHAVLYLASRIYRELAEAEAYRVQMAWPDGKGGKLTLEDAAARLAGPRYALGLSVGECEQVISNNA